MKPVAAELFLKQQSGKKKKEKKKDIILNVGKTSYG